MSEKMMLVVRLLGYNPKIKDIMYEVTVTKGTTTWHLHRPEKSLKWLSERMRTNGVKSAPKFKGLKKLKRKATPADVAQRERSVEVFLGKLVGAVGVSSIALHTPLRSWLEVDEEGRHGKSKLVSGINARAVCVVKAVQSYEARDDRELSFAENDIISIVDDSGPEWWKAKMGTRVGLVPASYVEVVARTGPGKVLSTDEQIAAPGVPDGKQLLGAVRAIADYNDPDPTTLQFSAGEVIAVTQKTDDGWWEGTGQSGASGWFPDSYVEDLASSRAPKKISDAARLELELSGYYGGGPSSSGPPSVAGRAPPPPPSSNAAAAGYGGGADDDGYYGGGADYVDYDADAGAGAGDYDYGPPNARALFAYEAADGDKIPLREGEEIWDAHDCGDGWTEGYNEAGDWGAFPTSYIEWL